MTSMSRIQAWQFPLTDSWIPAVEVTENGDVLQVSMEIPGVKPGDVRITMENNMLTIRGEKKQQMFERSFTVPNTVDAERISASYELGVLHIALPKAEKARARQIAVQVQHHEAAAPSTEVTAA